MKDESTQRTATCPLCGSEAESGCIYTDRGELVWRTGQPGFWANLATELGGGLPVGNWGIATGHYAEGIRCGNCSRIVLKC